MTKLQNQCKILNMDFKGRQTQKCPRCGGKALINQTKCPDCGLVFSKLEYATNKAAAERYKNGERNAVVFVRKTPIDLKKWKLILYGTLFGLFGAQYFYTRRWWWGILYLLGFILLSVCVIFNGYLVGVAGGALIDVMAFFVGIYGICWIFDIVRICFGRFKIPVSLPKQEADVVNIKEKK